MNDYGLAQTLTVQRGKRMTVAAVKCASFWTIDITIEGADFSTTTVRVFSDRDPGAIALDVDLTAVVPAVAP